MANKQSDVLEPRYDGALIRNKYVKAGLFIVKTKTQRNTLLKTLYRELDGETTTLCFVSADAAIYELIANPSTEGTTDQDWKRLDFGVSDILVAKGTWDADNTTPVLQDDPDAVNNGNDFYVVTGAATPIQVQHTGLFGGAQVTVKDGDWVISNGIEWFISASPINWDSISGVPTVINDYVAGTVIAHPHEISDVNALQAALDLKYDVGDVGDHNIAWSTVPDAKLVDVFLVKQNYFDKTESYSQTEVDAIVSAINPTTTKGDFLTHNGTVPIRKGVGADGEIIIADSAEAAGWKWGVAPSTGWAVTGTTVLTGAVTIDQNNSELIFKTGELSGSGFSILGTLDTDIDVNLFRFNHPASTAAAAGLTEVFLGAQNGNGAGEAWGNIIIGQNNATGLLPSGEWDGGRNVIMGYGIAPQFATPTANMSTHNVLLGRKILDASGGDISYVVAAGYEVATNVTSLEAGVFQQMVLMGIWAFEGVTLDSAADDIVSNHDVLVLGTSAFRGVTGMYNHGNSGQDRGGIVSTVAIGTSSFRDGTVERYNIGIGDSAFRRAIIGRGNIAIGVLAGADMTGGTAGNTGVGTTIYNILMGVHSGQFMSGDKNAYYGTESGSGNVTNNVTGDFNSGFGTWTLNRLTGDYNAGFGAYAGYNGTATLVGSFNAFLGAGASYNAATPVFDNSIVIATNYEQLMVSDKIYLGNLTQNVILNAVDNNPASDHVLVKDEITNEIQWRDAATLGGGGGGAAAGDDGDIQFNSADAFAASPSFNYDDINEHFIVGGAISNSGTNNSVISGAGTTEIQGSGSYNFVAGLNNIIFDGSWNMVLGEDIQIGATAANNDFITGWTIRLENSNSNLVAGAEHSWTTAPIQQSFLAGQSHAGIGTSFFSHSSAIGFDHNLGDAAVLIQGSSVTGMYVDVKESGILAHGHRISGTGRITAAGKASILLSAITSAQTAGHGTLAEASAIIGGQDGNVPSDSPRSVVVGGDGLKMPAATPDTVLVDHFLFDGEFSNVDNTFYYDKAKDMLVAGSSVGLQPDFGTGAHAQAGSWSLILGEEHDFKGEGGGGGRPVNGIAAGWHHSIGDTDIGGAFGGASFVALGTDHQVYGQSAIAMGFGGAADGWNSFVVGHHDTNAGGLVLRPRVRAAGTGAVNISTNNAAQTAGHGALADGSVIIGGQNHNIPADSNRSVILGGSLLKMPAATPDTVLVPNLMTDGIVTDTSGNTLFNKNFPYEEIWISLGGNDSNSGSRDEPLATWAAAWTKRKLAPATRYSIIFDSGIWLDPTVMVFDDVGADSSETYIHGIQDGNIPRWSSGAAKIQMTNAGNIYFTGFGYYEDIEINQTGTRVCSAQFMNVTVYGTVSSTGIAVPDNAQLMVSGSDGRITVENLTGNDVIVPMRVQGSAYLNINDGDIDLASVEVYYSGQFYVANNHDVTIGDLTVFGNGQINVLGGSVIVNDSIHWSGGVLTTWTTGTYDHSGATATVRDERVQSEYHNFVVGASGLTSTNVQDAITEIATDYWKLTGIQDLDGTVTIRGGASNSINLGTNIGLGTNALASFSIFSGATQFVRFTGSASSSEFSLGTFQNWGSGATVDEHGGYVSYKLTDGANAQVEAIRLSTRWENAVGKIARYDIKPNNGAGATNAKFSVKGSGELIAQGYGSGSITGTAVYSLAVDASGNIIEEALGGGGWTLGGTTSLTGVVNIVGDIFGADREVNFGGANGDSQDDRIHKFHIRTGTNSLGGEFDLGEFGDAVFSNLDGFTVTTAGNFTVNKGSQVMVVDGQRVVSRYTGAATLSAIDTFQLEHRTSLTPVAGFGAGIKWRLDNASNSIHDAGTLDISWTTATAASEESAFDINLYTAGAESKKFSVYGSDGGLQAYDYGGGSITGTATYGLAVDVDGKIVEVALGGGGWAVTGTTTLTGDVDIESDTDGLRTMGLGGITKRLNGFQTFVDQFNQQHLLNADTAISVPVVEFYRQTTATAAAGFGGSIKMYLENASGGAPAAFSVNAAYTTATSGSEETDVTLSTWKDGIANNFMVYKTSLPSIAFAGGSASGANSLAIIGSSNAIGADSISIGFAGIQAATGGIGIGRYSQTTAQGAIMIGYHTSAQINSVTDSLKIAWDGNTAFNVIGGASKVNYVEVLSSLTTVGAIVQAAGETNVDLVLKSKGTGSIDLGINGGKAGFFGVTGVIRQTTTSQTAATITPNTSGIVDDTATWNGYTIGDLVAILQAYGLLT